MLGRVWPAYGLLVMGIQLSTYIQTDKPNETQADMHVRLSRTVGLDAFELLSDLHDSNLHLTVGGWSLCRCPSKQALFRNLQCSNRR